MLQARTCFSFHKFQHLDYPVHVNAETEFVYVVHGELTVFNEHKELVLKAGDMAVISPYKLHGFLTHRQAEVWVVMFPYFFADEFLDRYGNCQFSSETFRPSKSIIDYLDSRYRNGDDGDILDEFMQRGLFNCLISEYLSSCTVYKDREQGRNSEIEQILYYLLTSVYTEEKTVEYIAKKMGKRPSDILNEIKRYLGISVPTLVANIRLQHAVALLRDKKLSIIDVAYQSGFGSVRTFNRVFQKNYKMTPSEYKTKYL